MSLSMIERVERAIAKKPMNRNQIMAKFHVKNVSAIIYDMRRKGYNVVASKNGSDLTLYSL